MQLQIKIFIFFFFKKSSKHMHAKITCMFLILIVTINIRITYCANNDHVLYFMQIIIIESSVIRGGNLCSHVEFVSCQLMNIWLYKSTLTRHVLLNRLKFLNFSTTYLLNRSVMSTCLLDFIKMKRKKKW